MKYDLFKIARFAVLGGALATLAACVDPEQEEADRKASLAKMSCAQLSTQQAVMQEKIKTLTEQATISAIGSAFTKGTKSDLNSISSSLSQIQRKDVQDQLKEVQLQMARKGCM